ncbi:MAG: prolipoprotein diacylglyceryl transferase [Coriobacteriia bacterium]|nr:prolipoprotein diacylglyceryl transferase [Coriobacteriia bacterium]
MQIGSIRIASYGAMVLLGGYIGALSIWFRTRSSNKPNNNRYSESIEFQQALFAYLYGVIGLGLGAKLFYLLQALPLVLPLLKQEALSSELLLDILTKGFVFYGGFIGGVAGVYIYSRQFKKPFAPLAETLIPAVPLAHAFGRIGCFMAGCCYGMPYEGRLSIVFELSEVAPLHIHLFPVQLLESALLFALAAFLVIYDRNARKPRSLFGWYLLLYGLIRMLTELFRGDALRGSFLFFSTSQWISVVLIITAIVILMRNTSSAGRVDEQQNLYAQQPPTTVV